MSGQAVTTVHQVLPSLHVADASGGHTLRARDALRAAGFASEIFVEQVDQPLADEARPFGELAERVDPGHTALLYQLSVGSAVVDVLLGRPEPLLVNYHNLTPASFFWEWAPDWLDAVALGRRQLYALADRTCHAIADSAFNERDLVAAGYRSTAVVPPLVEVTAHRADGPGAAGRGSRRPPADGPDRGARWLFVGKLLPHKGAHRLLQALAAYRRAYDPAATLTLVGGAPIPAYRQAVTDYAADLGLADAVTLAGGVSDEALEAHFAAADVFVCLSAHEGFCFPLVEAMARDLPVVAWDAGAVGDTAGDAAVVLRRPAPATVAAAVHRVVTDERLRRELLRRGRARVAAFDIERSGAALVAEVRRGPAAPGR